MGITLRSATRADFDFLWRLHVATMRPYVEQTWGWDEEQQAQLFEENFHAAAQEVVECDEEPIGTICVERRPGTIALLVIEIAPERQNQGIGTGLVTDLLGEADRLGLMVECRVLKTNRARALCERLGFQVKSETETHVEMRRFPNRAA